MSCMFPFAVANPLYGLPNQLANIPVPCGRCPDCLKRRAAQWSFRLQQEERRHKSAFFLTLTYDVPPLSDNGFMTLRKSDFQKFMKRLRFLHPRKHVIKYYAVGEYGTKRARPHYHCIIFGAIREHVENAWSGYTDADLESGEVYSSGGHVDIGTVTGASIGYTIKYMNKGRVVPAHARDDRVPEFSLMSKGLGSNYLSDQIVKYHRAEDTRVYVTNPDGFKTSMPRYYREKVWTKEERRKAGIKLAALHEAAEIDRQNAYIKRTGSLEGYDRSVFEAKKAAIINFRNQAKENRKDV